MKALWLGILITGSTTFTRAAESTLRLDLGGDAGIDLLLVPAGEFTQGSPSDESGRNADEEQLLVRLTNPFYISRTAVTRGQWERFVAETGCRSEADIGFRILCAVEAAVPIVERPLGEAASTPPVEIEHSPPTHVPAPDFNPPVSRKQGISWLLALPCLLIPIGLVIMLVRFASRGQSRTSPFTAPTLSPPPRPDLSQTIRKVADGFWVKSTHPPGTPIHLRYSVGGENTEQTLVYQSGPEGQFVYTGTAPDHISVVGSGSIPPPLSQRPPKLPDRDDSASRQRDRPTMFPPAY